MSKPSAGGRRPDRGGFTLIEIIIAVAIVAILAGAVTPLVFRDDAVVPTGGEWLPAAAEDYIASDGDGLAVTAPSVRVPWDAQERGFYQGTHHCKLITLAAMQRWTSATVGGETVAPEEFPSLLARLQQATKEVEVEVLTRSTLWDRWQLFSLFALAICVEWYLRKRWGLV